MAKADPSKEERKRLKEEKKNKKKSSEENGVHKSTADKKDKKSSKKREALAEKAVNELSHRQKEDNVASTPMEEDEKSDTDEMETSAKPALAPRPIGALVPFANPLADEKVAKKVFKGVKKAAAHRTLKRGVKEVVKSLRKSSATAAAASTTPFGIVVLAADISPMDVISHIPVLCEDHDVPYIYVTSRAELGMAGQTKRPTSVVMVARDPVQKKNKDGKDGAAAQPAKQKEKKKKKAADDDADADGEGDGDSWADIYKGLLKVVEREGRHVKI